MPATAGRVRMPANNRVHSSAALQTHGIWQSAIGYDPYAPDQKGASAVRDGAGASAATGGGDADNAYDSFQGLLQLAKLTGSNADEARGACRKCHRVGHLTFQCRNFLTAKEDVSLPAEVAADGLKDLEGARKRKLGDEGKGERSVGTESAALQPETSEEEESDVSDSSEDSEREQMLAKAARQRGLLPSRKRKVENSKYLTKGKSSSASRSREKSKSKRSEKKKRRKYSSDDSSSSDDSDLQRRRKRKLRKRKGKGKDKNRRHRKKADRSDSENTSESDSSSDAGRRKRHKGQKSPHKHKARKSDGSD